MKIGPCRLTRQRAVRAVAGLVAAFLLTGNVLAAAGLCAMKVPASHPGTQQAAVQVDAAAADAPSCNEHVADELGSGSTNSKHHCPTDDPSAQTRTVDVPAAQLIAAVAVVGWNVFADALQATPPDISTQPTEPQPLYARLQRLRL